MRELFRKFKALTGIKYTDVAKELGITKQAIDYSIDALTSKQIASNKQILTSRIDRVIAMHQETIKNLEQFKAEVNEFRRDYDEVESKRNSKKNM